MRYWVPTALLVEANNEEQAQELGYAMMITLLEEQLLDFWTYDVDDPDNGVEEAA